MTEVIACIRRWGEMVKFSHSLFALPFALLATFLAARPRLPSAGQLGLIVACMVAARSAAMTFNRIADARIDAQNPRTARRQIPAGLITLNAARVFFLVACGGFLLATACFWWAYRNPWPIVLAPPTLIALCAYSYTKRFTRWSHLVLGAVIAFAPLAAWIAIQPQTIGASAVLLTLAVMFWIAGFDVIYACQDVDFDRASGLHSLPSRLGVTASLWLARGFHVVTAAALIAVGLVADLGGLYFAGVGCAILLLIVENALVRADDLSRVNLAFFTVNGVVGLVLGVLGVLDIVLRLP